MRLTVVMPVYNAMPYLELAVESLLGQTFQDFCLVAIDDGSTDRSVEYLASIKDQRFALLRMETNKGQGAARNLALEKCKTEFVAFADADDISLPKRLEVQVAYLDRNPGVGMLGSRVAYMGPTGRAGFAPPLAIDHPSIRRDLLQGRHAVANSSLMFRTAVFQRTGFFRVDGVGEDWDLFLRMTEQTRVENLPEIHVHYRLHRASSNGRDGPTMRVRYQHSCECAKLREVGLPEVSFEAFCKRRAQRAGISWVDRLYELSNSQYRTGVVDVLEGAKIKGYMRLALSAALAPQRITQRISRSMRSLLSLQGIRKHEPRHAIVRN